MESGAILIYLAEKTGKLMSSQKKKRFETIEWLMWQMGGIGPMLGQAHHFLKYNRGQAPYAEERYAKEAKRLSGVLNRRLEGRAFMVDDYSIADIATWPWISRFEWQDIDLNAFPNVKAAGMSRSPTGRRCRRAITCRNTPMTSRCPNSRRRGTSRCARGEGGRGAICHACAIERRVRRATRVALFLKTMP